MTKFLSNFGQFFVKFWPGKTMKTQGGVPRILELVESWVLGIAPGLSVGVLAHFVKKNHHNVQKVSNHQRISFKILNLVKFGPGRYLRKSENKRVRC